MQKSFIDCIYNIFIKREDYKRNETQSSLTAASPLGGHRVLHNGTRNGTGHTQIL